MTETIPDLVELWLIQDQQGLGKLSKLPPEVRSMIWQYILPDIDNPKKHRSTRCRTTHTSRTAYLPNGSTNRRGTLAILRTSRLLYTQITEILYHNRTLTICFNQISHDHNPRHTDQQSNIFIPICSTCKAVDARDIAFSRFAALDIRIQFCRYRLFPHLLGWVHRFAQAVRHQQQSSKHRSTPFPPKLSVTITECSSRRCDCHLLTELVLVDVFCLLRALSAIGGVEPAEIKVHIGLGDEERRHLPEIVKRFDECVRDEERLLDVKGMNLGMDFHYMWQWVQYYSGCTTTAGPDRSSEPEQSGEPKASGGTATTIQRTATSVSVPVPAG